MARSSDDELRPEEMLQSLFRLWQRCELVRGNRPPEEWGDLDEDTMSSWAIAYSELLRLTTEPIDGMTYDNVAATVHLKFHEVRHAAQALAVVPPWDQVPEPEKLIWRALVRHLCNLLSLDFEEDGRGTETHEEGMALWFEQKLKELPLPERDRQVLAEQRNA